MTGYYYFSGQWHTLGQLILCESLDLFSEIIGVKKDLLILLSVVSWLLFELNFINRSGNYRKIKFLALTGQQKYKLTAS